MGSPKEHEAQLQLSEDISPSETPTVDSDRHSLTELAALANDRFEKDTRWRCRLSWWVIAVDSVWLAAVLSILALNGGYLHLNDAVLITLLASTTANVLGLAFIVLKGLFSNGRGYTPTTPRRRGAPPRSRRTGGCRSWTSSPRCAP